jgi:hypothetical protein
MIYRDGAVMIASLAMVAGVEPPRSVNPPLTSMREF